MLRRHAIAPHAGDLIWIAVSLLALVPCVYYPQAAHLPDTGFTLLPTTWEVVHVEPCPRGEECPRVGDRVLSIGGLTFERYRQDRMVEPVAEFAGDGRAEVRLLRGVEVRTLEARLRRDIGRPLTRSILLTLLPLVFWLMGTALVIFLRPHDERWLILVLFSYLTAVLLASGMASARHAGGAAVVFHVVVWLFLPLAVHLHLLLPSPLLGRGRAPLIALLYGGSFVLLALDAARRHDAIQNLLVHSIVTAVAL